MINQYSSTVFIRIELEMKMKEIDKLKDELGVWKRKYEVEKQRNELVKKEKENEIQRIIDKHNNEFENYNLK